MVQDKPRSEACYLVMLGALLGLLSVAAGAVGSHALAARLPAQRLALFELAAQYQMYHALALILVGMLYDRWGGRLLLAAGSLFLLGILLFTGSLYALVLTEAAWVGALTPLGGLAFLAGWFVLAGAAVGARQRPGPSHRTEPG